jgi:hypothetical protein
MTENEVRLLGFEKQEENDEVNPFHYYTYKIADGFEFISCANDEVDEGGNWHIEFFNSFPQIKFYNFGEVQSLINLIEKRVIK